MRDLAFAGALAGFSSGDAFVALLSFAAKRALGERGPVWWTDGAPDLNRPIVRNTPYSAWYASLEPAPTA